MKHYCDRKEIFSLRKYKAYGTQTALLGAVAVGLLITPTLVRADVIPDTSTGTASVTTPVTSDSTASSVSAIMTPAESTAQSTLTTTTSSEATTSLAIASSDTSTTATSLTTASVTTPVTSDSTASSVSAIMTPAESTAQSTLTTTTSSEATTSLAIASSDTSTTATSLTTAFSPSNLSTSIVSSTSATINSNTLTSVAPKPAGTVRLLATVTPNPATSMNITRIDTGKATNDFTDLTGKAVALSTNLTVSDTATTISNAYVLFTFTDTYAGGDITNPKITGLNNQVATNLGNGVYKLPLGTVISGSTFSLPIIVGGLTTDNGNVENGTSITVLAQLYDGNGVLQNQTSQDVTYKTLTDLPTVSTSLTSNDAGTYNGAQIVGYIDDATGTRYGRSTRNYNLYADETFKTKYTTFFGSLNNSVYGGLADGYTVRVTIPSDQIGEWAIRDPMNSGFFTSVDFATKGYFDISIDGTGTATLFQNFSSFFEMVYTGNTLDVPDSFFTISVYKNGQKVSEIPEMTYSHKNIWVHKAIPNERLMRVTTLINFDNYYNDTNNRLTNSSDYGKYVSLAPISKTAYLVTETTFENATPYPNEFGIPVSNLGYTVPTQVDGGNYFPNVTSIIIYGSSLNSDLINNGHLYYLDKSGQRHDLGTYASYASLIPKPIIKDAIYVGLDLGGFIPLYGSVTFWTFQSRDTSTPFDTKNDLTSYSYTTQPSFYTNIRDSNAYKYTADITYQPNFNNLDSKINIYKSNFAAMIDEVINFQSYIELTPIGALVEKKGVISISNVNWRRNFSYPINDATAYIFIAVPTNLSISPFTDPYPSNLTFSNNLILKEIIRNKEGKGLDYYIYDIKNDILQVNFQMGINYTINQEIFYKNLTDAVLNSTVATGTVFKANSRFVGNEVDPLDFDGDGKTNASGTDRGDIFVVSTSQPFSAITPKALFVYDKSLGGDGLADFNKSDVYPGSTVTISPEIANTTDVTYKDMTLVTALPSVGDLVYAGDKSRGSQISLTLVGPVTAVPGWTATYCTTKQASGTAVSDLSDWKDASQITDWSTVTAIKWVSDSSVVLLKGQSIRLPYQLKIPSTARIGQSFTTTSALAVNGSTSFLEGYRSVTTLKTYPMTVTGRIYVDKNVDGSYETTDSGKDGLLLYLVDSNGNQVTDRNGILIPTITSPDGTYMISVPYPDTNYSVKVVSPLTGLAYETGYSGISSSLNLNETNNTAVRDFLLLEKQVARFIFIDKTDGNKELLRHDSTGLTGDAIGYDAKGQLDAYLAQGYVVDSQPTSYDPNQIYTADASDLEEFIYVLVHGTKAVSETESVTRTINYIYGKDQSQASPSVSETAHFNRTGTRDQVTGVVTYNPWVSSDSTFNAVTSPVLTGYSADKLSIGSETVSATDADLVHVVTYLQEGQNARFIFIDKTDGNKELLRHDSTGLTGDAIGYDAKGQLDAYLAQGYVVDSQPTSYDPNQIYTADASDLEEFIYVLVHGTKAVSETESVTRTINYIYGKDQSQASPSVSETLRFKRVGIRDKVTGNIIFEAWMTDDNKFDEVISPKLAGYRADRLKVDAKLVDATSLDSEEFVIYTQEAVPPKLVVPVQPSPSNQSTPSTPSKTVEGNISHQVVLPHTGDSDRQASIVGLMSLMTAMPLFVSHKRRKK
ncbi:mucin-binding protein [Streptococcus sp. FSL E2-3488]|uniref:mucin-binding protein n=1 Tax=Streptococcus sp. FSL E2-3488 TaxID=2921366 RepID=UPI0030F57C6D